MSSILILHVKKEYFEQIKSGEKTEEYRNVCKYWEPRIEWKANQFLQIGIVLGYANWKKEPDKILLFPWNGYDIKTITHRQFGNKPTLVYAIKLLRVTKEDVTLMEHLIKKPGIYSPGCNRK